MLTVRQLTVSYGERCILNRITFSVDTGLTVLLGQNGAGKTTLLRAVAGTVPFSGDIRLDGETIVALSVKARATRLSQVTSSHNTLSGITGGALVQMALYARHSAFGRPTRAECDRIAALAEQMGVSRLLPKLLDEMSTGEVQLLRLLAAAVQDTPLCLLDEPTASLDYNRTRDFLSRTQVQGKNKIILATLHDPALALHYADRILLLTDGEIVGDFRPDAVSEHEADCQLRKLYPNIHIEKTKHGLAVI